MRKLPIAESHRSVLEDMHQEYRLEYRKARPSRFAARLDNKHVIVIPDPDISQVFTTGG